MRNFFLEKCQSGDVFFDASIASLTLETSDRVASFLDAHPSVKLHNIVADRLKFLLTSTNSIIEGDEFLICKKSG
jgi:hypothetical protein